MQPVQPRLMAPGLPVEFHISGITSTAFLTNVNRGILEAGSSGPMPCACICAGKILQCCSCCAACEPACILYAVQHIVSVGVAGASGTSIQPAQTCRHSQASFCETGIAEFVATIQSWSGLRHMPNQFARHLMESD